MCAFLSLNIGARRPIAGISSSQVCISTILPPSNIQEQNPNIYPSALLRSREVAENARNGPVAAIDTRDDVLDSIRDTRLSDPDSWRTVIQNAPLTERKYLSQVYELLSDLASEVRSDESSESYTNAFIYNYRTGSCVYYDLGPCDG